MDGLFMDGADEAWLTFDLLPPLGESEVSHIIKAN